MELIPKDIPMEFLQILPEGIKLVNRYGHPYLVMDRVVDANGNSLMDESVRIHGEPSIKMQVKVGDSEGLIFVDAYWGSHAKLYSFIPDFSQGKTLEAFSPADGSSLMVSWSCPIPNCAETHGIKLSLPGGENSIIVCGKLGCPGHQINVAQVGDGVRESLSNINFFGEGEDELFSAI
ncbi:MAG: hypothetical protein KAH21_07600 [Spirochaetaceae bacterium]|nr:hypothetical protein [Spirochaetaceae bacterium]